MQEHNNDFRWVELEALDHHQLRSLVRYFGAGLCATSMGQENAAINAARLGHQLGAKMDNNDFRWVSFAKDNAFRWAGFETLTKAGNRARWWKRWRRPIIISITFWCVVAVLTCIGAHIARQRRASRLSFSCFFSGGAVDKTLAPLLFAAVHHFLLHFSFVLVLRSFFV